MNSSSTRLSAESCEHPLSSGEDAGSICLDLSGTSCRLIAERVKFSRGTCWAHESPDHLLYETDARIVRSPWRPVDDIQQDFLLGHSEQNAAHHRIAIIDLPKQLVEQACQIQCRMADAAQRQDARRELAALTRTLSSELKAAYGWDLMGEPASVGFSSSLPGMTNTTVNSMNGLRVGLHLDSWDRLPIDSRWRGSNRICLNIGKSLRYLQFVPLCALSIAERLALGSVSRPGFEITGFSGKTLDYARKFLAAYPNTVVFRVAILPGEAYIAPTENMIHDGSSEDSGSDDVTLTIRGHFHPITILSQGD